jgi:serpin B
MKRLYILLIAGLLSVSVLAGVIAFSPHAQPNPNEEATEATEMSKPEETAQDAGSVDQRLIGANTRFGFKLYAELARRSEGKNLFISPTSISMALAMTYNGAVAETKDAMAQTLEIQSLNHDELNRGFSALRAALTGTDAKVKLQIANSLWGKQSIRFNPDFIQRNRRFYGAEVTTLDFGDPASPGKINAWVKDKTAGKIDKIIDQIDPQAVLYLLNAIYFKGTWADEFKKSDTKDEPFKIAGSPSVPIMHQSGKYQYLENPKFQAVALPYGGNRASMYIFLPAEGSSLAEFHRSLTAQNWAQWMSQFAKLQGDIGVPRFKLEYEMLLNDPLKALGMGVAFDADRANFTGIADSSENISISRVKHKTFVDVNEEGTEAAAVTSVEMVTTSAIRVQKTFRMIVDRPFFFAIRDNQTGQVLFMGSVADPR